MDPASVEASKDDVSVNFLKNEESLWKNTAPLSDFVGKASEFDAIFYAGGHGRQYSPALYSIIHEMTSQNMKTIY